jgi:hypothetical protein
MTPSESLQDLSRIVDRDRYSDGARRVLAALDQRIAATETAVLATNVARTLLDPASPREVVRAVLREIMFGIAQYQPHTTEAGFAMLGRFPKDETKILMALTHHKVEEAEHGIWAKRDFVKLGGDPARLGNPPSAAIFAVTAVWWRMAAVEASIAYVGAEYLFEKLTMRLAPMVMRALSSQETPIDGIGFLEEHATEDIKHTNLLTHCVLEIATRHPSSGPDMLRGFDYFRNVYPLPVWNEAYEDALRAER